MVLKWSQNFTKKGLKMESLGGNFKGIMIQKLQTGATAFYIKFKDELNVSRKLKVGESPHMTKTRAKDLLNDKKNEIKGKRSLIRGSATSVPSPIPSILQKKQKPSTHSFNTLNNLADFYFSDHSIKTMKELKNRYDYHVRNEVFAQKPVQLITKQDLIEFIERKKVQRSDKRRGENSRNKAVEEKEMIEYQMNLKKIAVLSTVNDWRNNNQIAFLKKKNEILLMRSDETAKQRLLSDKSVSEDDKRAMLGLLSRKTIKEIFQICLTTINYSIDSHKIAPFANPFVISKRDKKLYIDIDNIKDRYMSKDEIRDFLKECKEISKKPKHKNIFLMALLGLSVAARQSTILSIRISDIDLENGFINLRNHKTEKWYSGFIGSEEIKKEILKLIGDRDRNDYLFVNYTKERPYRYPRIMGDILDYMVNYKHRFIKWLSLKDLRNTSASHLAMQGVPISYISQVLNHSSIVMTERYAHLSPSIAQDGIKNLVNSFGLNE